LLTWQIVVEIDREIEIVGEEGISVAEDRRVQRMRAVGRLRKLFERSQIALGLRGGAVALPDAVLGRRRGYRLCARLGLGAQRGNAGFEVGLDRGRPVADFLDVAGDAPVDLCDECGSVAAHPAFPRCLTITPSGNATRPPKSAPAKATIASLSPKAWPTCATGKTRRAAMTVSMTTTNTEQIAPVITPTRTSKPLTNTVFLVRALRSGII